MIKPNDLSTANSLLIDLQHYRKGLVREAEKPVSSESEILKWLHNIKTTSKKLFALGVDVQIDEDPVKKNVLREAYERENHEWGIDDLLFVESAVNASIVEKTTKYFKIGDVLYDEPLETVFNISSSSYVPTSLIIAESRRHVIDKLISLKGCVTEMIDELLVKHVDQHVGQRCGK